MQSRVESLNFIELKGRMPVELAVNSGYSLVHRSLEKFGQPRIGPTRSFAPGIKKAQ
jgi:hypothetical protein